MSPRLYCYIGASDKGFAPNPFHGMLTLPGCTPQRRDHPDVGDDVIGLAPKRRDWRVVYAMKITGRLTFDGYWDEFSVKRPDMNAADKRVVGDNIYHWDVEKNTWRQEWSQHSEKEIPRDTSSEYVLVSTDFVYWGGGGPGLPDFLSEERTRKAHGRGYMKFDSSKANELQVVDEFIEWFNSSPRGQIGMPLNYPLNKNQHGRPC